MKVVKSELVKSVFAGLRELRSDLEYGDLLDSLDKRDLLELMSDIRALVKKQ